MPELDHTAALYSVAEVAKLSEAMQSAECAGFTRGTHHLSAYFSNPDLIGF